MTGSLIWYVSRGTGVVVAGAADAHRRRRDPRPRTRGPGAPAAVRHVGAAPQRRPAQPGVPRAAHRHRGRRLVRPHQPDRGVRPVRVRVPAVVARAGHRRARPAARHRRDLAAAGTDRPPCVARGPLAGYALWPTAVLHGFGTGSDIGHLWFLAATFACIAAVTAAVVVAAVVGSAAQAHPSPRPGARPRGCAMSAPPATEPARPRPTGSRATAALGPSPAAELAAHHAARGPLPRLPEPRALLDLVEASGLTGRGGAGVPDPPQAARRRRRPGAPW